MLQKGWSKFRLWAYIKLVRLQLKMGLRLFMDGNLERKVYVLKVFHKRIHDTIWDDYDDPRLQELNVELLGTALGLAIYMGSKLGEQQKDSKSETA